MPAGACRIAETAESAGHTVGFLDLMFAPDPVSAVEEHIRFFEPDCVGLSIRNVDNGDFCDPVTYWHNLPDLVFCVRAHSTATVLIGGGAVSVMPGEMLRVTSADLAVMGEGERVVPSLAAALERGGSPRDIPGVGWLADGNVHCNPPAYDCPMDAPVAPDYHRWIDVNRYLRRGATVPVQTKRGCPRRCVYCTYPLLEGRMHRHVPARDVADAVVEFEQKGVRDVEFVDNVFNDPREHAFDVCSELAERGCGVRLHTAEISPLGLDEQLLAAMQAAGFVSMGLTVESASNRVLSGLKKGYRLADVRRAAEAVHACDIPCMWIYLLGGPGETPESVKTTLDFAERNVRPGDTAVFFPGIRIFPGTAIESVARREGQLPEGGVDLAMPVFYLSPEIDGEWLIRTVKRRARHVPAFLAPDSRTASFIPLAYRLAGWLGVGPPLWRYTGAMRRFLAPIGF